MCWNVDGIEHAAPMRARCKAFYDIFAAVVEFAVAEQEAESALNFKIFLMVALDGVGDDGEADLVDRAMPTGSGIVGTGQDCLITSGVGQRDSVLTFVANPEAARRTRRLS